MAEKHCTTKAARAVINIGNIAINVYQLPDGSYRLAGRSVTDAVGEAANSLLRSAGVKSLKALPHADESLLQVKSETGEAFVPVAIEDALDYWVEMAVRGNVTAKALVRALGAETIERRADTAFGVQRTEQEINARLAARMEGKDVRMDLQAAIAAYLERHPECSENYRKWVYKNCTDAVIRELWGKNRKALAKDRGIGTKDSLRDLMGQRELTTIKTVEEVMARLITLQDMDPMEAAIAAVERTLTANLFAGGEV